MAMHIVEETMSQADHANHANHANCNVAASRLHGPVSNSHTLAHSAAATWPVPRSGWDRHFLRACSQPEALYDSCAYCYRRLEQSVPSSVPTFRPSFSLYFKRGLPWSSLPSELRR